MKKKGRKQNEKTKKDSKINKNWTNIMSENIKNMKNNNFTDREKQELKAIISKCKVLFLYQQDIWIELFSFCSTQCLEFNFKEKK